MFPSPYPCLTLSLEQTWQSLEADTLEVQEVGAFPIKSERGFQTGENWNEDQVRETLWWLSMHMSEEARTRSGGNIFLS